MNHVQLPVRLLCRLLLAFFLCLGCISCTSTSPCTGLRLPTGGTKISRLEKAVAQCEQHWEGARRGNAWHLAAYQVGVRQTYCLLGQLGNPRQWQGALQEGGSRVLLASPMENTPEWNLANVDRISLAEVDPAEQRPSQGLFDKTLGLPVVLHVDYRAEAAVPAKLFPLHGRNLPSTLLVDCAEPGKPRLRFINTTNQRYHFQPGKSPAKLATNFHAPAAATLQGGFFGEFFSLPRLFRPDKGLSEIGIYSLLPYQPGKIPVVFIHGLESDPSIWTESVEALWSDPTLSVRYQVWYFLYPTGLPVPESAARLRQSLEMARSYYDPQRKDVALDRMVLVGHSMGGVLTRWQITDPQQALWQSMFTKSPEELPLRGADRDQLKRHCFFAPASYIKRAVFLATPHRGSEKVQGRLVEMLIRLIKVPTALAQLSLQIATLDTSLLQRDFHLFRSANYASITTLRPDWPGNRIVGTLPITIPHHSIIGRTGLPKSLAESTDGAVPYSSSHLSTAQSEKVIGHWHSLCRQPESVAEIMRILRLHE